MVKRSNPLLVEVLTASGCGKCLHAQRLVQSVVSEFDASDVRYRAVNVVDELDYAVELGVLITPAVAVDGRLAFATLPTSKKLRASIDASLNSRMVQ